jgi:colicin import membrane protein
VKRSDGPPGSTKARPQPGRIRAVFLAALVHGAFFALIVFGVRWQTAPTAPLQAELWAKLPPAAAKAPEPPKPAPEPPKPEPPKEEAKPEPAKPDPAIALKLEREKREKEVREKLEKERAQKQKEEEARKKREREEEAKKKREEEIAKREAEQARQAAAAARASEIDRYTERIKAKIRGRANVPDTVTGNPEVQVRIHVLPGGEVLDIQITKRSGSPAYDAAIERAIRSAQPLPVPPADSELFPPFRDLMLNIRHDR